MKLTRNVPSILSILILLYVLPVFGNAEEKTMHRLITFIRGEEEIQGFWSFRWNAEERSTSLLLRGSDGNVLELEQLISLRPIFAITSTLSRVDAEPLLRLEVQYPSVVTPNFSEAGDRMGSGEPVVLTLGIKGEEDRRTTTTVPEDQTEEYVSIVRSLVAPKSLGDYMPDELRGLIQTFTEVAGPERQLKGGDPDSYPMAFGLLGALDSGPGKSEPAGMWTIVENPRRVGEEYDKEEREFLVSAGKVLAD